MRFGILKEIFRMSFDSIRSHKLRSFLTLLGIMIGVMTVIAMVSVIQGLNRTFMSELESAGADLIVVSKYEPGIVMGDRPEEERRREDLTYQDAEAIQRECPLLEAVSVNLVADIFQSLPVKYGNTRVQDVIIMGVNADFPRVLSVYLPRAGRFITQSDVNHRTRVCVLGADIETSLFPQMNALGREIRIGPEKFTVVGVLEKRGSMFGQSRDNIVAVPITALMKYFPYDLANIEIIATPAGHGNYDAAVDQIINVLRQQRKVPFGEPNNFAVYGQEALLDLYNQITGAAYLVMIVISSIGLLVGGIGVMNIMLVTVKERTREIGIRKAVGAKSNDIMKQFLIEAVLLTSAGGGTGIAVGFAIAFLVRSTTPLPASVTLWSVVLGFSVSMAVGLFFGIFPARKAARMDPIVSLRYE